MQSPYLGRPAFRRRLNSCGGTGGIVKQTLVVAAHIGTPVVVA